MKTTLKGLALLALMILSVSARANDVDDEVDRELERMYSQAKAGQNAQGASGTPVQVNVTQTSGQNQVSDQQARQAQVQMVKQPTTYIEASPLTDSKADMLRKARQDAEVSTEQKIVEKLERSRLEDERRRSEVLFGDKFHQMMDRNRPRDDRDDSYDRQNSDRNAPNDRYYPPQPPPQPPVVVVPAPTPVEVVVVQPTPAPQPELTKEEVRAEVSAALSDYKQEKQKPEDKAYFSAIVGTTDYSQAVNVKSNYALGLAIGKKYDDAVAVEGSVIYSNFYVEQPPAYGQNTPCNYYGQCFPRITEMNQYQVGLTAKYLFFPGFIIRPILGVTMAYTYRSFTDVQFGASDNSDANSDAIDYGVVTGADLEVTKRLSIGLDLRYMWNLSNRNSAQFQRSMWQDPNHKPIETLSYMTFGISAKSTF